MKERTPGSKDAKPDDAVRNNRPKGEGSNEGRSGNKGEISGKNRRGKGAEDEEGGIVRTVRGEGLKGLEDPVAEGTVILNRQPISFFGDMDVETGICINPDHDIVERSIAGKVLVFPSGAGSTVGSYSLMNLALNGVAPKAILVKKSDPVLVIGCCIAEIPHIHGFSSDITKVLTEGMKVKIDSEKGTVEIREG